RRPLYSHLLPYTTLFRSVLAWHARGRRFKPDMLHYMEKAYTQSCISLFLTALEELYDSSSFLSSASPSPETSPTSISFFGMVCKLSAVVWAYISYTPSSSNDTSAVYVPSSLFSPSTNVLLSLSPSFQYSNS